MYQVKYVCYLDLLVAAVAAYFIATNHPDALQNRLALLIFKNLLVDLGFLFVPFAMIVIVGSYECRKFD